MDKDFYYYNNIVNQKDEEGFYKLENDILAINSYKLYIDERILKFSTYEEKITYLIENGYYINFFKLYEKVDILDLAQKVYEHNFQFQSLMAIQKFYDTYSLKTNDKKYYLETYEDRVICVSLFIANGDINYAEQLSEDLIKQIYQPATPTFLNSGRKQCGELISCFLLENADSLNSINYNLTTAMQLSKIGGGVAIDLTNLRSRGESIKGIEGIARGVLPVMKLYEDAFSYIDQLGQRPGAGCVYLNIFHADILEFLDTKKINSDEKNRIQTLSIGLKIPDMFFELAKNNEDMYLFHPYSVYKKYKLKFEDINFFEMYHTLVNDEDVKKTKVTARQLLKRIAITQFESGYPYLVFIDNANKNHALQDIGKIKLSNLCTEIFQLSSTSQINDYGVEDEIGYDVCCNLGSFNIVNMFENNEYENVIYRATKALSLVSNRTSIANAPGVNKANTDFHAIGLGVMNLHGFFAKNNISYVSEEAKEFCDIFFMMLNYYSIKASNKLAQEFETKFKDFENSDYATGKYFTKYYKDIDINSQKIKELFNSTYIPNKKDWEILASDVAKFGLYNAYRLAIAPTQSISYIQNSTASIMPISNIIETRIDGKSQTYYPMPYLRKDNIFYYTSAYNMDQKKIIDLVSIIQNHIDQGISTVLYVTSDSSTNDLASLYYYAWKKNLKSLYYVRTKNLTLNECESCSV